MRVSVTGGSRLLPLARSSSTIAMAAATGGMTDAARTVMNYLYSTREAYHQRPVTDFRDLVGAQVILLKRTIAGVMPDHADATIAINEIRAATIFTDDERNSVIDAIAARMGQHTAVAEVRYTSAVGQTCKYFYNFCTAAFWEGVMNLLLTFSEGMELTVTMAFQIGLRHPREGTLAVLLSTLICARNEQHKHDAPFYYDKINAFRVLFIQRRARMPPPTHALLQRFPDTAERLVAACPNLYQNDAPPRPVQSVRDNDHRPRTSEPHSVQSLVAPPHAIFATFIALARRSECPYTRYAQQRQVSTCNGGLEPCATCNQCFHAGQHARGVRRECWRGRSHARATTTRTDATSFGLWGGLTNLDGP